MSVFVQIMASLGGLAFVGGIITALAVWRKSRAEAKKTDVDAVQVLTGTALTMVEDMRKELAAARTEMQALRTHMGRLETALRTAGMAVPEFHWPQRNGAA